MMCILYKSYIWTADKEQKWKWSSQLWSNLSSYKQSPEKKSEASTGFKPMTSVPTGAFTSNEYHRCLCFFIIYKARLFLQNKILSFLLTTVSACLSEMSQCFQNLSLWDRDREWSGNKCRIHDCDKTQRRRANYWENKLRTVRTGCFSSSNRSASGRRTRSYLLLE